MIFRRKKSIIEILEKKIDYWYFVEKNNYRLLKKFDYWYFGGKRSFIDILEKKSITYRYLKINSLSIFQKKIDYWYFGEKNNYRYLKKFDYRYFGGKIDYQYFRKKFIRLSISQNKFIIDILEKKIRLSIFGRKKSIVCI